MLIGWPPLRTRPRGHLRHRAHAGDRAELAVQLLGDLGGGRRRARPSPAGTPMRPVCISSLAPKPPGTRGLKRWIGLSSPVCAPIDLLDLLHLPDGVVEAGAFRALDGDLERAAVFGRRQFGRHQLEQQRRSATSARRPSRRRTAPAGRWCARASRGSVRESAAKLADAIQRVAARAVLACGPHQLGATSSASASARRRRRSRPRRPAPPTARGTGGRCCLP